MTDETAAIIHRPKWQRYDTLAGDPPRGLLFIGDPHVSMRRPGRRKDEDFRWTVLGKLASAMRFATEENLLPVILGDLFQMPRDATPEVLSQLIEVMRQSKHRPVCDTGNHDKYETLLTPDCSLWAMAESGAIHVARDANAVLTRNVEGGWRIDVSPDLSSCSLEIHLVDGPVALLLIPYGQEIPDVLESPQGPERTVVVTHEDFDFGGGVYPGARTLKPIVGASLMVNGHMHETKAPQLRGRTWCVNPGNITRQSMDMREHVPAVWSWSPGEKTPTAHPLPHAPATEAFDFTGIQVDAASGEAVTSETAIAESLFAQLLQAQSPLEQQRTQDGALLDEEITAVLAERGIGEDSPVARMMRALAVGNQEEAGLSPR